MRSSALSQRTLASLRLTHPTPNPHNGSFSRASLSTQPRLSHKPLPPSFTTPSSFAKPSAPSSSPASPSALPPALTVRSKDLFKLRPTHRRFPLHNRHNPLHPLTPRPLTAPPSTPPSSPPTVPFLITRTPSRHLPVYLTVKGGGTLPLTSIRRIEGDLNRLAEEMRRALGPTADVRVRAGRVEVKGNWKSALENWLITLGF